MCTSIVQTVQPKRFALAWFLSMASTDVIPIPYKGRLLLGHRPRYCLVHLKSKVPTGDVMQAHMVISVCVGVLSIHSPTAAATAGSTTITTTTTSATTNGGDGEEKEEDEVRGRPHHDHDDREDEEEDEK